MCIELVSAPDLSDQFLAKCDRYIQGKVPECDEIRVPRYVDDYLVLPCKRNEREITTPSTQALDLFKIDADGLFFSVEMFQKNRISYLNLTLFLNYEGICWCFEPRAGKGVLPFDTAHSKLVKREGGGELSHPVWEQHSRNLARIKF